MRLRDAAITLDDYKLWQQPEINSSEDVAATSWPGGENLVSDALFLVAENAQAGRINGQRLASTAPRRTEPALGSSSCIVVRCEARHNNARAEQRRAADFRNLRRAVHFRVGARVILTLNSVWGVQTVPLGLMNGARGVVVAILFAEKGGPRSVQTSYRVRHISKCVLELAFYACFSGCVPGAASVRSIVGAVCPVGAAPKHDGPICFCRFG